MVINNANAAVANSLDKKYFQIGQPLLEDDIFNVLLNVPDVISVKTLRLIPRSGNYDSRVYSNVIWNKHPNTKIHSARNGSLFEMKYPEFDIVGVAT